MRDERLFENKIDAEITILMGTEDDAIPLEWILKFAKAQEATIRLLKDDHRFTRNLRRLPDIISEILKECLSLLFFVIYPPSFNEILFPFVLDMFQNVLHKISPAQISFPQRQFGRIDLQLRY